ncbi:hypothetical protein ACVV2G_32270 [Streptomyces ziwulingensis]
MAQALIGRPGWPQRGCAGEDGMAAANCYLLKGQVSERFGQVHRNVAEAPDCRHRSSAAART